MYRPVTKVAARKVKAKARTGMVMVMTRVAKEVTARIKTSKVEVKARVEMIMKTRTERTKSKVVAKARVKERREAAMTVENREKETRELETK